MENYDDVRQFITKVGEQNLNYRSFQTNRPASAQWKWRMINQVEHYTEHFSNPVAERTVPIHGAAGYPESPSPAAFQPGRHTAFQSAESVAVSNPFRRQKPDNDIAQLHKKSQQQSQADIHSTKTDSLAALFYRIAL